MILLLAKRNSALRTYEDRKEYIFKFKAKEPTLKELQESVFEHLEIKAHLGKLALYIPHQFEWQYLDPEHLVEEKKGKKGKNIVKTKLLEFNLKKFPYTLRDGCVIGVKDLGFEEGNID